MEVERINEDGGIDWSLFSSEFVKFEENEPMDLVLTNWRQTEKEYGGETSDAVCFDVIQENGVEANKKLETSSKRLVSGLKPLILKADKEERKKFKCRITRTGQAKQTRYSVKELEL
jgi:hypothetical protein